MLPGMSSWPWRRSVMGIVVSIPKSWYRLHTEEPQSNPGEGSQNKCPRTYMHGEDLLEALQSSVCFDKMSHQPSRVVIGNQELHIARIWLLRLSETQCQRPGALAKKYRVHDPDRPRYTAVEHNQNFFPELVGEVGQSCKCFVLSMTSYAGISTSLWKAPRLSSSARRSG